MQETKRLCQLRERIDAVDEQIVGLLNQRADLVLGVKAAKHDGNIKTYSPAREALITERVLGLAQGGSFPKRAMRKIFIDLVSATRSLIGDLNIAYLGQDTASKSCLAAEHQFGEYVSFKAYQSIDEIFEAVEKGKVDYGVMPFWEGDAESFGTTVERFYHSSLQIVAELMMGAEPSDRFISIGKDEVLATGQDKTSVLCVFSTDIGNLEGLLEPIKNQVIFWRELVVKSDKRGAKERAIYCELKGHREDEELKEALKRLEEIASFCKVLGTYSVSQNK